MLDSWLQRFNLIIEKCERFGVKYTSHMNNQDRLNNIARKRAGELKVPEKSMLEESLLQVEEKVKSLENYFKNFDDFTSRMKQLDYSSAILRNLDSVIPKGMK